MPVTYQTNIKQKIKYDFIIVTQLPAIWTKHVDLNFLFF